MANTDYYICEIRFPFKVDKNNRDIKSPEAAADEAIRQFCEQYGFSPDRWKVRVTEFSSKKDAIGGQREFFFSPSGTTCIDIHKNLD